LLIVHSRNLHNLAREMAQRQLLSLVLCLLSYLLKIPFIYTLHTTSMRTLVKNVFSGRPTTTIESVGELESIIYHKRLLRTCVCPKMDLQALSLGFLRNLSFRILKLMFCVTNSPCLLLCNFPIMVLFCFDVYVLFCNDI